MVKAVGLENSRVLQGVKGPGRQPRLTGCGKGEGFVRGGGSFPKGLFLVGKEMNERGGCFC